MSIFQSPERTRHVFTALAVLAGLGAASEPAEAQAGVTTYYACYVPGSGTIYRIKTADTPPACRKSTHVEFQWVDFGRSTNHTQIVELSASIAPGTLGAVHAQCPLGSILYSGGYSGVVDLRVTVNRPNIDNPTLNGGAWLVMARNEGAAPQKISAYALCLRL